MNLLILVALIMVVFSTPDIQSDFVQIHSNGKYFELNGKRYTFLGTNYWYGVNIGALKSGDRPRLLYELDQLVSLGIRNLRIMAGSQGDASNPRRISPSL